MVESEITTKIVEGYDLVENLQGWSESVKTWVQDSPLDSAEEDIVLQALKGLLIQVRAELDVVTSSYIEALIDSRAT